MDDPLACRPLPAPRGHPMQGHKHRAGNAARHATRPRLPIADPASPAGNAPSADGKPLRCIPAIGTGLHPTTVNTREAGSLASKAAQESVAMTAPEPVKWEIAGTDVAVRLAGDRQQPALLLIHGFPSASTSFRNVIGPLSQDCFVIAPDLPGFGGSAPIGQPSFAGFADLVDRLLAGLGVASFHLYLHDFGAVVGLHLATRAPHRIRSLIIQNANAHESGMGPGWAATRAYWDNPTPEQEAEATRHLTFDGTRDQYVGGVPADIAARIDPRLWEADWRIMSLPGRIAMQRRLVLDYRSHFARFREIADYLTRQQPPALLLWGRHDIFFELDETLSWMRALPRMAAHILDGPHFLLETHPTECTALMRAFIRQTEGQR
ncbi:alpha/beta hydrolase [Chitiniphilus purpureus]|uniref:Alpha/beta hydrolase n=1 Tax=Chitiniphilus purpureus TaxID=2981137 RepID=A0ABY6DSL8_9NEIS|nr:alpha/beta hydrolase [Chitiniphilus sp. CD1]UXY14893.1 alpha/beta hydrolase [Chitiniphilus sp. CD1]